MTPFSFLLLFKLINIVMTTKNSIFGKLTVAAALCSSAIMCASTASAAGFQLTEQSVAGMGLLLTPAPVSSVMMFLRFTLTLPV